MLSKREENIFTKPTAERKSPPRYKFRPLLQGYK